MSLTIIEDCSPYFIRFTHPEIEKIIEYCSSDEFNYEQWLSNSKKTFIHYKLTESQVHELLSMIPMTKELSFVKSRVSMFVTAGGRYYRAHKDGLNVRCGINYNIIVRDDKCVTSWYGDNDLNHYTIDTLEGRSREASGFEKTNHTPLKSMSAVQGECVLFNTEIFHDFDNSQSDNLRVLLTLRFKDPEITYFDDVKKKLFGI